MSADDHLGAAREHAIQALARILEGAATIEKAVLVNDLFGLLRVILWLGPGAHEESARVQVSDALAPCGRFWTGEVWVRSASTPRSDDIVYASAWREGITVPGVDKLRIDDRTRTRTAWLPRFREPAWEARRLPRGARGDATEHGPPILVFYSFKGGVGRTTALAAFAIQRAREGERVFVIDFDVDAPGVGTLLSSDTTESPVGIVDYLLGEGIGEVDVRDYVHTCRRESLVGDAGGEIVVMGAGRLDDDYITKLSRLDVEVRGERHPLEALLAQARERIKPDWVILDSRAGLSPAAGLLLDGVAHIHVLFGTSSAQSQLGLRQVIRQLGEARIVRGHPQARCLVAHAMVVDIVEVERAARSEFNAWLDQTLRDHYVVKTEDDPENRFLTVSDLESRDSVGRSIAISYRSRLAFFPAIDDVAHELTREPYAELGERILARFPTVSEEIDGEA